MGVLPRPHFGPVQACQQGIQGVVWCGVMWGRRFCFRRGSIHQEIGTFHSFLMVAYDVMAYISGRRSGTLSLSWAFFLIGTNMIHLLNVDF